MPASLPSIAALPRGHVFPPAAVSLTPEAVATYVAATQNESAYAASGGVPPLAAAALALRRLLEACSLPPGSLHTGQEVEFHAAVRPGDELTMTGSVTQRSERAGMAIVVVEFAVSRPDGTPVVSGRTTVMAPQEAEA
ncbi:MAG TPA: MaoC family dehydratase [Dehalococcoidia bacterium]|nr:MaoC family dehydratase [Dehalococcoidia bacterium]